MQTRRDVLKKSGSALATLMAGLPGGWVGGAYADDSPETTQVRFGIIALTDCSSIVMAHEARLLQEVRNRIRRLQGSVLGGDPRQAHRSARIRRRTC